MMRTRRYEEDLYEQRRPSLVLTLLWRFRRVLLILVAITVALLALGFAVPLAAAAVIWPPAWPLITLAVAYAVARRKTGTGPAQYAGDLTATAREHRRTVLIASGVGAGVGLVVAAAQLVDGGGAGSAAGAFAGIALAITVAVVAYLEAAQRRGAL